jgi:hypothetical protein
MKRRMIPMPERKPGQIINPERQKKRYLMKALGLKSGKQYQNFLKQERRKVAGHKERSQ